MLFDSYNTSDTLNPFDESFWANLKVFLFRLVRMITVAVFCGILLFLVWFFLQAPFSIAVVLCLVGLLHAVVNVRSQSEIFRDEVLFRNEIATALLKTGLAFDSIWKERERIPESLEAISVARMRLERLRLVEQELSALQRSISARPRRDFKSFLIRPFVASDWEDAVGLVSILNALRVSLDDYIANVNNMSSIYSTKGAMVERIQTLQELQREIESLFYQLNQMTIQLLEHPKRRRP